MSDQPEPLDAVLAEFRAFALRAAEEDKMISPESVLLLADKVETAVERERNAHKNDIHDALYKATGIPGNAAALRKALEEIDKNTDLLDIAEDVAKNLHPSHSFVALQMRKIARAALAAPARNCDRFQNWHDAMREEYFTRSTPENVKGYPYGDEKRWREFCDWLFAPAEGGAK